MWNKNVLANSLISNTFLVAVSNATRYANFSIVELDRSIKKITNRNERKCWHALRDWCFVINTVQLFCFNDRIWYPINLLPWESSGQKNIILSNSTFYNLSIDIYFVGVSFKTARVRIFFWRTPTKVWSNLNQLCHTSVSLWNKSNYRLTNKISQDAAFEWFIVNCWKNCNYNIASTAVASSCYINWHLLLNSRQAFNSSCVVHFSRSRWQYLSK